MVGDHATRHKRNGKAPVNGRLRGADDLFEAPPPHSPEHEKGVIASILRGPHVIGDVARVLRADDVHVPQHRRIYECMLRLHADSAPADRLMVRERLRADGAGELLADVDELAELGDRAGTAANAVPYARVVVRRAEQRRARTAGIDLIKHAADDRGADDDPAKWCAGVAEIMASAAPRNGAGERNGTDLISLAALSQLDLPDPRWAVPGLICEGLNLLVAAPKWGKSWLAFAVGLAVASGGRALGNIEVAQGDVLALFLEDNLRRVKGRLAKILGATGDAVPARFDVATTWPAPHQGGIEAIEQWIDAHECPRLIIIDTLARFRPPRGRNGDVYAEDYAAVAKLKTIGDKHRVAILALHHVRKAKGDDPLERVSGTYGVSGAADVILVGARERGRHDAVLHVTGRDVEERELALSWDRTCCAWSLMGEAETFRLSAERQAIVDVLAAAAPDTLGPTDVAERLGRTADNIKALMHKMASDGQIKGIERGRYTSVTSITSITSNDEGNRR